MNNIKDRVFTVIAETLDMDVSSFNENTTFVDAGIDSLDMMELFIEIETEFDVSIPDSDVEKMQRFGDIVTWLEKK